MPLSRDERKLIHQKSKQPTFGNGKPDTGSGNEGDIAFRKVHGSGTVQYLKQDGDWIPISSSGQLRSPVTQSTSTDHSSLLGLGSDDHEQYLLISGSRAMTGNLNMGTNDIGSVGALDVDGHTTLDQVTINTADGAFSVSGANPINLSTSSSNDININTSGELDVDTTSHYDLAVGGNCNWDVTGITDWRNTGRFILTGVDNITVQTNGASTEKTILLFNDNDPVASFRGIHLKTDSKGTGSVENSIFIECDGRAAKGAGDGVDIRSEDGILIRAEDPVTGTANNIKITATEHIDLHGGPASITATTGLIKRTKIHGVSEIVQLYRPEGSKIITNLDTISSSFGASAESGHTEFEAINTQHLLRAITYKTSTTEVWETDTTCHVTSGSSTVTHDSNETILKGQKVTGADGFSGIPANTFVGGTVSSTQFSLVNSVGTLVNATDGDGSEVSLQFFNVSEIEQNNKIGIVHKDNDDNKVGTTWQVTVTYNRATPALGQTWYAICSRTTTELDVFKLGESTGADGTLEWDSSVGITWRNDNSSDARYVKASALRIQSGDDF